MDYLYTLPILISEAFHMSTLSCVHLYDKCATGVIVHSHNATMTCTWNHHQPHALHNLSEG